MAIVNMSKFSLFAFDSQREELLHELQKFEYVHFNNINEDESLEEIGLSSVEIPESVVAIDENISKVKYSIDILSQYDKRETGIRAMKEGTATFNLAELENFAIELDTDSIYEEVKSIWEDKEAIVQEIDNLKTSIIELQPWLALDMPITELKKFEKAEVIMGTISKKLKDNLDESLMETEYTYFEVIGEDKDNLNVLALTSKEESEQVIEILRKSGFAEVELDIENTPKEAVSAKESKIADLSKERDKLDDQLEKLSEKSLGNMEVAYDYYTNEKLRVESSQKFAKTNTLNVIEGYVPSEMEDDFSKRVKRVLDDDYYLEVEKVEKTGEYDPNVPILLKNSKFAESFESLTTMYALPRYNEIDPTPFLAPFYLIFFGMMAADVGYGLMLLIGSLVVLRTFNLSETTERFVRFFFYLSFAVTGWGLLYGSIFGGIIPMQGLFDPAADYNSLLILSIVFGLIHIYYGLALQAYVLVKEGKHIDALFDVGFWYLALTGAILLLISMVVDIPAILASIGLVTMIIGMLGIVATGGRESKGLIGRIGGGVYSLYGISSYVGDFVSYSRLMALGLAGGFIANAVNMMADMVVGNGIIGIIAAILIFIGGQVFNFGLTLLSAYVHAIRLTFVEFFGKFYEGGGKGFNLFKNKPKYINLK